MTAVTDHPDPAPSRDTDDASVPRIGGTDGVALIDASSWLDLDPLVPLFDEVPADPYVEEGFRYKAISRIRIRGTEPVVGPHEPLYQSLEYNPVHGDIDRRYAPLTDAMVSAVAAPLRMFQVAAHLPQDEEVLVQVQRVTTGTAGDIGHPAVEGFHQDGVNAICILLVDRVNLIGGQTLVSTTADGQTLVFAGELRPGQFLVADDRRTYHYTSPVWDTGTARGHRDVVLFGWPSCRRPADGESALPSLGSLRTHRTRPTFREMSGGFLIAKANGGARGWRRGAANGAARG